MGWRVGYIAYPNFDGADYLGLQLVKVQDTWPIHSAHMSQKVALGALARGRNWVASQLPALRENRHVAASPLSLLGTSIFEQRHNIVHVSQKVALGSLCHWPQLGCHPAANRCTTAWMPSQGGHSWVAVWDCDFTAHLFDVHYSRRARTMSTVVAMDPVLSPPLAISSSHLSNIYRLL